MTPGLRIPAGSNTALMRRIKAAFDPDGILNPGTLLDTVEVTR
jgi:FAD/FMN-containing dehydrogenase